MCLFLGVLELHCCLGFSLVMETGGYSLFAMCGLFIAMASFFCGAQALECGLQ